MNKGLSSAERAEPPKRRLGLCRPKMRGSWACTIGQPLQCYVSTEQQDSPTSVPRCVLTWPLRQLPPCPRRWSSWARKVGPGSALCVRRARGQAGGPGCVKKRTASGGGFGGKASGLLLGLFVLLQIPSHGVTDDGN